MHRQTKACPAAQSFCPKAGLSTQRCCPASPSSKLCPWPRNCPIRYLGTCLRAGGAHVHSLPPFPWQPLRGGGLSLLPLPEENSSDLEKSALIGQEFLFPLEQRSKTKENHSLTTVPEPQWLWLPAPSGSSGLERLSHSSTVLLLPPSSWVTGFSKIQKIQEGQGEKQQPPESSPRVDVSGFPTSQAGKTSSEAYTTGRQLSDPAAQRAPSKLRRPLPAQVASPHPRERGAQRGALATSGRQLSGLFCLPNSSAVSEPEANPDESQDPVQR